MDGLGAFGLRGKARLSFVLPSLQRYGLCREHLGGTLGQPPKPTAEGLGSDKSS